MTSPYADLERPPLSRAALTAALGRNTGPAASVWRRIAVVPQTRSTNADVAAAARAGEPEGLVVVAEHQTAGRGRLDRVWTSPPRAGLTFSMLLRPGVPPAALPLLPLLVATGAAAALTELTEVEVRVKWPNDLLVDGRKVAGLLAEAVDGAVVVGLGLNVSTRAAELPVPEATSLAIEAGRPVDRQPLLLAILRAVAAAYQPWVDGAGAAATVLPAFRARCATIGAAVEVGLPSGEVLTGAAVDVDDAGRLVVESAAGPRAISAGDVRHVRPARAHG
jgi:BirA family transcriptional regulator, biotin operon repressor / biotin---[acetyl-CoA-carboxylase] ligase